MEFIKFKHHNKYRLEKQEIFSEKYFLDYNMNFE
jgi:hypothetical protein